jgi:DNA-binding NarL/FixJ family response regulator
LTGTLDAPARIEPVDGGGRALAESETRLLTLLTEGHTNREIAEELQTTEEAVARQLAAIFVKIGASSRADATATALMGRLV